MWRDDVGDDDVTPPRAKLRSIKTGRTAVDSPTDPENFGRTFYGCRVYDYTPQNKTPFDYFCKHRRK